MYEQVDRVVKFRAIREVSDSQRPFVGFIAPRSLHHIVLEPDILVKVVLLRYSPKILQ